jgi:hypothetical protein
MIPIFINTETVLLAMPNRPANLPISVQRDETG